MQGLKRDIRQLLTERRINEETIEAVDRIIEEAEKEYLSKIEVFDVLDKVEKSCKNSVQPVQGHEAISVARWQLQNGQKT